MGCELSYGYVVVVLLLILVIYNWRDQIFQEQEVHEHMKQVLQYTGHGRPPGSGGGPLWLVQRQTGGIAGITETISLNATGGWEKSAEGGFKDRGTIPDLLARKILADAEKMTPSATAGNCLDCFRYEVSITYPSMQVVRKTLDRSVFPSSLGF